jgi:hypothetical protein
MVFLGKQHFLLAPFPSAVSIGLQNQQSRLGGPLFNVGTKIVGVEDAVSIKKSVQLQFVLQKLFEFQRERFAIFFRVT